MRCTKQSYMFFALLAKLHCCFAIPHNVPVCTVNCHYENVILNSGDFLLSFVLQKIDVNAKYNDAIKMEKEILSREKIETKEHFLARAQQTCFANKKEINK